jgi:acyl-CoA-binding protein
MTLTQQFTKASEDVKGLSTRPSNETLLSLYALYKQATEGDVTGKKPGLLDLKARKKFEAWESKKGLTKEAAMLEYTALVQMLLS